MSTTIGSYIQERRQALGLSQNQLADRVGGTYGQSDISRLERGFVDVPRLGMVIRLASALEVPVGHLLIASGWFGEGHLAAMPTVVEAGEEDALATVLSEVEAELETLLGLEGEARTRSDLLRAMIPELNAMSGLAVTLVEHEHHG